MTREKRTVLVVDDDADVVEFLVETLQGAGWEASGETSPAAALARVGDRGWDIVLMDVEMPEMRGLELMNRLHAHRPDQLVVLMTAFGSIDLAVTALRQGACDFLTKPFEAEILLFVLERALRERRMRREIVRLRDRLEGETHGRLVARSPAMRKVVSLATRAARTSMPVLVTGESGVGKGLLARHIHEGSARAGGPFLQINCAALPGTLVEAELFGVRKGAFTDAREDREGVFVQADGGTLFLDEIGEMPSETQPTLLHALESGRIRPVGGQQEAAVDVRLVAATNRPLEEALRERRFRPDLYYRLNVIRIEIPPLRERREDIEPLVDALLRRACATVGRDTLLGVSAEAMHWLVRQEWPGNVRELANTIERAVALSEHDTLFLDDVATPHAPPSAEGDVLRQAAAAELPLAEIERMYIERVMEQTDGNKVQAAKVLGIDRRTLYRRLSSED